MPFSYPLPRADFLDQLRVKSVQFSLDWPQQISGTRGGDLLSSEVAPPYWIGSVALANMSKRQAAGVQALLGLLKVPGRSFEVYKPQQIGPAADPAGVLLAGHNPQIASLHGSDAERIRLEGLPAGFVISPGDFIGFDYNPGTGPRRALHQVALGRTAAADGATASHITVTPPLRPGAAAGTAVDLVRPHCIAALVPGSVSDGITAHNVTSGMSFQFRQKLRA